MLFFKRKEKRAEGEVQFEDNLLTALIGGDLAATRKSALEIPAVQSCVELLAGIVSSLPVKLYEETDGKVTEIKDDIRTRLLNGDTGDVINGTELRKQWVRDYFLGKGAYTYIDRDIYGKPRGLYYVSESRVSVIPNNEPIFKDYTVMVEGKAYPKSDFLKILRGSSGNGRGVSIVEESPVILITAYNTMRFENSVVKKGGNKRGFLTSQRQLTKDVMKSIKEAWRKMFSNSIDAEDNICVLNEGMDFKEASATALEMQLNENKNTNSAEICKLFGVPPEILSGNASQQVRENFVSNSVAPLLNVFEAAMDSDLLLENEKGKRYFAFDTRELTRGNILQRYNAYSVGLKSGFLQFDDVRELEDMEPLDFPYIKLGLNDVLYNPVTKEIYTPNTNAFVDLGKAGIGLENDVPSGDDTSDSRAEELRFNPYHDPKTGKFTSGSGVDKSGKSGIIKSGSDEVSISTIEQPIEQQHTGKGNPNAILTFDVPLNERQQKLLDSLPEYDSRITVPKKSVNMTDLSALTAKTGDEFALFTKGGERLVIRGNEIKVNISPKLAKKMCKDGYKWSGHTHPGCTDYVLTASDGDKTILKCFEQEQSVIYNSKGNFRTFELNE